MNIEDYYYKNFQNDLDIFKNTIPNGWKHYDENPFTIQYFYLTPKYNFLDKINNDNKPYFVVCLFWHILIDQVCYTYYRDQYYMLPSKFKSIKFLGNCTAPSLMASQCGHNQHPQLIFKAINDIYDNGVTGVFYDNILDAHVKDKFREPIVYNDVLKESIIFFKYEINSKQSSLFDNNFLKKCTNELPNGQ
jgi:hypothetical protein